MGAHFRNLLEQLVGVAFLEPGILEETNRLGPDLFVGGKSLVDATVAEAGVPDEEVRLVGEGIAGIRGIKRLEQSDGFVILGEGKGADGDAEGRLLAVLRRVVALQISREMLPGFGVEDRERIGHAGPVIGVLDHFGIGMETLHLIELIEGAVVVILLQVEESLHEDGLGREGIGGKTVDEIPVGELGGVELLILAQRFGLEKKHGGERRTLRSEDLFIAVGRLHRHGPAAHLHPALNLGESRFFNDRIGRHRHEHFLHDEGRLGVALEPLIGHREAQTQGGVEVFDGLEIGEFPLDPFEDGLELKDDPLRVGPLFEDGDTIPDLFDFCVLIVKETRRGPDALEAGNRLVVLLFFQKGRAELKSERLEADDLGHAIHVPVLAPQHREGLVGLLCLEPGIELENDRATRRLGSDLAVFRQLLFEKVGRLGGEILLDVERRKEQERLVALKSVMTLVRPVLAEGALRGNEFACGHEADAAPEAQLVGDGGIDLRIGERLVDPGESLVEFLQPDFADRDERAVNADGFLRLLGRAVVGDKLPESLLRDRKVIGGKGSAPALEELGRPLGLEIGTCGGGCGICDRSRIILRQQRYPGEQPEQQQRFGDAGHRVDNKQESSRNETEFLTRRQPEKGSLSELAHSAGFPQAGRAIRGAG